MTSEVVTVRMSRGDLATPWGLSIQPPSVINNIIGSSLADRAGLQNGDVIEEIQGYQNPDYQTALSALDSSKHSIEIIVLRNGGSTRLWKPHLGENTEMNRFQHSVHNIGPPNTNPPPPPVSHPIKVSLEHRKEEASIRGFNSSAKPFSPEVQAGNQQQYNTPINLYSAQNAAEQYLQQTGGLFGTDPNLAKQKEEPAYLRSETLRLIRENEQHSRSERNTTPGVSRYSPRINNDVDPLRNQPNPQGLPQCFLCGRNILGVMCRAFNHDLHADCFTCATCGSSLKNQGHHFLNDKFYCDIHGRQLKGRGPSMDPEMAVRTPPTAAQPIRTVEPVKAFYQPDVMTRQPVSLKSVSPTPWNTQSPISPNKRGVPPSQTAYGQQFRETRTTTTNNHFDTSPALLTPSNNLGVDVSNVRRSPLPPDIRKVTSPRLSKSPKTVCWPPKAPAEKTSNRYWHIAPETKVADKWISLQELVRQEDNRDRGGPPSPKRYLLRGETKKPEPLPPDPVRTQNVDPVILKVLPPNVFEPITVASMYDNFYPSGSHEEPDDEFEVAHYRERSGESIPARWANVSEIVEERDIMTENSSTKRSDDEASLSLKHIVEGRRSDDETTADQWDSDSETERWMREEVELARKERELAEELAKQRLQELARDASGAVEGSDGVDMDTDFDRDTELSEVLETTQDKPESPYEDFNEHDAVTSSTSSCHPSGAKYDLCEALFVPNKITIPEEAEESPLISEEDKRMAIESIERHQRTLQDQQQQLSALLDDAILFLKGLDSDFSSKYLETPLIANRLRYKEDQESKDTSLATPSVSETTLEPHYSRASKNIVRALSQSEEYTGLSA